ncbi:hypothetical protein HN51_059817 [Arachis hypogaea]
MANRYPYSSQSRSHIPPPPTTFLGKLQHHATTSPQLFIFFTLLITTSIFIFLSGLTLVAITLSLIIFFPLIILLSPIWLPLFIFIFLFLSLFGFGVVIVAALSWAYRYYFLKPVHSFGSVRIHDSPRRAKPYARENEYEYGYGAYLAPGA